MGKPAFTDILDLIRYIVLPFHEIKRDMDIPLKTRRKETDTEHSWTVAFVCCSLAERIDKNLDLGKIAQLAIVHDLVELYAGDTSVWDTKGVASKEDREKKALQKIKRTGQKFPWVINTIEEYEKKESPESLFVWAADKLIANSIRHLDLEAGGDFFKKEVPRTVEEYKEGIEHTRKKAHAHKGVGKYYEKALAELTSHPEWFLKKENISDRA